MLERSSDIDFIATRDRGRGAARRAELHQAPPAAFQRPAARRQVVPVHRDHARRGVPARLLHARAPPARPRLLRALQRTPSACARRSTCSARSSSTAPATGPSPAARRGSPCLDYFIKRCQAPCVGYISQGGVPREHRHDHRLPVGPLPPDRARARAGDAARPPSEQEFEQAAILRNRLKAVRVAARAPADRERGGGHARRDRASPPRARTPTRRSSRCATACWPTARASTSRTPRPRRGRGGRGVRAPVLRERARDAAAGDRAARAGADRAALAEALSERRGAPVEVRHAERGDKRRIFELAERNARLALDQDRLRSEHRRTPADRGARGAPARARAWSRSRCGSSASTSPTWARRTRSPRWSCSRAARRRSPTTGASRIREAVQDDFAAMARGALTPDGAVRRAARALAARPGATTRASPRCPALIVIDGGRASFGRPGGAAARSATSA